MLAFNLVSEENHYFGIFETCSYYSSCITAEIASSAMQKVDSLTICQYYQLSEYVIVSEIFVIIPNVILSNVIPKELSYI